MWNKDQFEKSAPPTCSGAEQPCWNVDTKAWSCIQKSDYCCTTPGCGMCHCTGCPYGQGGGAACSCIYSSPPC